MSKSVLLVAIAFVGLGVSVPPVSGADKPVIGTKIVLRDPVDPTQKRFNFLSRDQNIIFGANADSDTPTVNGASILVFNPVSSECQCIVLPATGWSIGGQGNRYLYRDPSVTVSPVKLALVKAGKVKIVAKGSGLTGISLDETQQQEIAVHITSGTGNKLCADFTTSSIRANQPGAFIAVHAAAPGACAAEPVGCTPCVPPIVP